MKPIATSDEGRLRSLVDEYSDDRVYLLEFLRFWGKHPFTLFDQKAILESIDYGDACRGLAALAYLVDKEVVVKNRQTPFDCYRLTESEPFLSELLTLSQHDWSRQNMIQDKLVQRGAAYA